MLTLSNTENIQKAILNEMDEGVLVFDSLGIIDFANLSFQQLVGYSLKDLKGLTFNQLIKLLNSMQSIEEIKVNWQTIINETSTRFKIRIKHQSGYIIPLQIDAAALYDDTQFCGASLICRDLHAELLLQVTQTINSSLKLNKVLDNVISVVVDYLGLAGTAIFSLDKDKSCLRLLRCNTLDSIQNEQEIEIPLGVGAPGIIAESREPVYVRNLGETDLIQQSVPDSDVRGEFNNRSSIGFPLIHGDELLGVIAFDAANVREFSRVEQGIFKLISNHVALALNNAELYSQVERLSLTDGLTGFYNHRYFNEKLDDEWKRAIRLNTCLSLLILDIDNFKNFNDKFGHLQGDKILIEFSELVKKNLRSFDIVFRYGGDEFTVILPECTLMDAANVAERIRIACEEYDFVGKEQIKSEKITVSIGVASSTGVQTAEELFVFADKALYRAKNQCRNKVVTV